MRHFPAASAVIACLLAGCGTMPTAPQPHDAVRPRVAAHGLGGGEVMFNPQPDPPRVLPTYPTRVTPVAPGTAVGFDPQPDPPIVTGR